jgi:hypothetical protein
MNSAAKHCLGMVVLLNCWATPAHAIYNGTPTTSFAAVARGVQVAPDWVFTASHFLLGVGDTYSNGYGSRTVSAVYSAPGSTGFPANDFSMMRLAPVASGTAPFLPVNGTLVPYGSFAPWDVTIASGSNSGPARGYGFTAINESLLTYVDTATNPATPYTVNWLLSVDSNTYVQGGDSGGGLFAGHATDSSVLMGISSAQLQNDVTLAPEGSAFVQPAAYRSWIDNTLLADPSDNQAVAWTTVVIPVPEPSGVLLGGVGLLALAFAGARRLGNKAPSGKP